MSAVTGVILVLAVLVVLIVVLMVRERFALLHAELDEAYAPKPLTYETHVLASPGRTLLHLYVPDPTHTTGVVPIAVVVMDRMSRDFREGSSAEFTDYARWIERHTYSGPFGAGL